MNPRSKNRNAATVPRSTACLESDKQHSRDKPKLKETKNICTQAQNRQTESGQDREAMIVFHTHIDGEKSLQMRQGKSYNGNERKAHVQTSKQTNQQTNQQTNKQTNN